MIMQVICPELKAVQKRIKSMNKETNNALKKAINSTVRYVESQISKEMKKQYIVKASDVKKTLSVRRAKNGNLSASVISKSNARLKLYKFRVSPAQPQHFSPPNVFQAMVKKESGLKNLTGSGDRSKAFVAKMESGHVGIFQRQLGTVARHANRSSKTEAMAEMTGPAVPTAIRSLDISKPIRDTAGRYLREQIQKELERVAGR